MLNRYQSGVGLLEVLIALLLLAVAVLGFSAMQMRAIQATDETLTRSDAMVIVRNVSEDLRMYADKAQKDVYITALNSSTTTPPTNCASTTSSCSKTDQAKYHAAQAKALAKTANIKVGADYCPETELLDLPKVCLIASWNETEPNRDGFDNSCLNSDGVYQPGASCIVMETY